MGTFRSGEGSINEDVTITGTTTFNGPIGFADGGKLTIADGTVTVTHSSHTLDGESGAADDLNRINGGTAIGQLLILRKDSTMADGNTITIKDWTTGDSAGRNLNLPGHRSLTDQLDTIVLMWTGAIWIELAHANNET